MDGAAAGAAVDAAVAAGLAGAALLVVGLAGAVRMLGGARRVREPFPLVGALGGADTLRADVRGGVSGLGLSVLGDSSRGGTLGSGTPRAVRFDGGPERLTGSAGGRERFSAGFCASASGGDTSRERTGALGAADFGAGGGLLGGGNGPRGADLVAGREGSGAAGGSMPATS